MPEITQTCRQCGIEFITFRRNQDFCTIECRKAWWDWHWKHEQHRCPACGTVHQPVAEQYGD